MDARFWAKHLIDLAPYVAQAGLKMMQQGAAIDAAIAAAATLMIVEPVSNGLGSDYFSIVWDGMNYMV